MINSKRSDEYFGLLNLFIRNIWKDVKMSYKNQKSKTDPKRKNVELLDESYSALDIQKIFNKL